MYPQANVSIKYTKIALRLWSFPPAVQRHKTSVSKRCLRSANTPQQLPTTVTLKLHDILTFKKLLPVSI